MDSQMQSRKLWRRNAKKLQRKRRRRLAAAKRDEELKLQQLSPSYEIKQAQERALELVQLENIEHQNEIENNKWLESEIEVEIRWNEYKLKIEEHSRKVETERRRIQEEFEAEQKRAVEIVERKKRLLERQKQRELGLKNRIQAYLNDSTEMPPELMVEAETNPGKEECSYFTKSAACRFGNRCVNNHKRPKIGKIVMMPGFFNHINLEQNRNTEYGSDLSLEHDESDLNEHFKEFFVDVVPEFEHFGQIEHFVVCKNYDAHIRGHVFVEYSSEREALRAQRAMNGRYYAGRQLNVEFCRISWRSTVCGRSNRTGRDSFSGSLTEHEDSGSFASDFVSRFLKNNHNIGLLLKNKCRMGRSCRFMHVFANPCDLYSVMKTLRESSIVTNSHRNGSVNNDEKDSWNSVDEASRRNWRWSESPIRENVIKNVKDIESKEKGTHHKKDSGESRSRATEKGMPKKPTRSRSRSRTRNRSRSRTRRSRSQSRNSSRSRRGSCSRSSEHRKRSKRVKKRSRSRSKKKGKHSSTKNKKTKKHSH